MNRSEITSKLSRNLDAPADIALLKEAIAINSITGNETPFARFIESHLKSLGLETYRWEFLNGRENVYGTNHGSESGTGLMFVGHSDVVHTRGWAEYWGNDLRSDPFAAIEKDGYLWGRGSSDLKGGLCAAIAALRLLKNCGFELSDNVSIAVVGDEESGEPGTGVSAGVKDLVDRFKKNEIPQPEFAIYLEPTNLAVYTAQIGFFIVDVTISGKTAYFGTPEQGIDALKATHEILSKIWEHDKVIGSDPEHNLVGRSSILATSIKGGEFIAVPGQCKLSLIRKLRPGEDIDNAVAEFEKVLDTSELDDGISITCVYPAGRDHAKGGSPVEISKNIPHVKKLVNCLREIDSELGCIGGAPYWSEIPFFTNEIGCPSVYCAPGDIAVAHTFEERIQINEYLSAVKAFALFAVDFCGLNMSSKH